LVSLAGITPAQLLVRDDETDFYGKQYWLNHQNVDLGSPDIYTRARNDLTERNLHWLRALLKYRLPPARVLELGCAHGSFVALLRQVGYDAGGVEMSPWVVDFGRKTFDVPILIGPIEALEIPLASFDAIVLMDVLEHLPNPVETMKHCLRLLKPDGFLLIQTPQFRAKMKFAELVARQDPFIEILKADEHLYLFSDKSVTRMFRQLGASHIQFEPAIFAHYDMFFAVSRTRIRSKSKKQIESALFQTSSRRLVLAMLDLRQREQDIAARLEESEADRLARSEQIAALSAMLKDAQTDNSARGEQIATLTAALRGSETDRNDRAEQIASLSRMLKESEADRLARSEQIAALSAMLKDAQTDNSARGEQIATLTAMLKKSEVDRNDRAEQIASLSAMLNETQGDNVARGDQIASLTAMLKNSEADRIDRAEQYEHVISELRVLFARPGFRWLIKLARWSEVKMLIEKLGLSND
jgi:2-polyprenyl-3-methyl-5-hydroxy-6-metoxy-1,4-benzoquinol methylase